jgi:hypothetical protein
VYVYRTRPTYLKNAHKILDDSPVIIVEFVASHLQTLVSSNFVNHHPVCEHKLQHVIGGVPGRHNITGDKPFLEVELMAGAAPSREGNCGQMDYRKRQFSRTIVVSSSIFIVVLKHCWVAVVILSELIVIICHLPREAYVERFQEGFGR